MHTKAPWFIAQTMPDSNPHIRSASRQLSIAEVIGAAKPENRAEVNANAALLCAAPELLVWLKAIFRNNNFRAYCPEQDIVELQALIKRAEGG